MKYYRILQTALLTVLTAAALTIVVQNQLLLERLDQPGTVSAVAKRVSNPVNGVIDVRIVDVKDEIPVNIEEINGFSIFGSELPVDVDE
jgi:hypothetical protein